MNFHTDDTIRAEVEYRRERLVRAWPRRRRHKNLKEENRMTQAPPALSAEDEARWILRRQSATAGG